MEGEGYMVTFSSFRVFFVLLLGSSAAADAAAAAMINSTGLNPDCKTPRGQGNKRSRGDINSNRIVPVTQRRSSRCGCDWPGFPHVPLIYLNQTGGGYVESESRVDKVECDSLIHETMGLGEY
jgi:hypothetical protein